MVIISPSQLVRNSLAAHIFLAASAARWTDIRSENSLLMSQSTPSSSSSDDDYDDDEQPNTIVFETLPIHNNKLQHPCNYSIHQIPWKKVFDCWQSRWDGTFCSSNSNKNSGLIHNKETNLLQQQQKFPSPSPLTVDEAGKDVDYEMGSNQSFKEDATSIEQFDTMSCCQHRLTQYPTFSIIQSEKNINHNTHSSSSKMDANISDSMITVISSSNEDTHKSHIQTNDNSSSPDNSSTMDRIPKLDSSILGILSCHGIEPRIHDYSILVEEMSCTSMIHDIKTKEDTRNTLSSWIHNFFSGTLFLSQKPIQTTSVAEENRNIQQQEEDSSSSTSNSSCSQQVTSSPSPQSCPDIHLPTTSSKINQDRAHVLYPTQHCKSSMIVGVYDGHGQKGELVAEYIMNAIEEKLSSRFTCRCSSCPKSCCSSPCPTEACRTRDDTKSMSVIGDTTEKQESIQELYTDIFREVDRDIGNQPMFRPLHSGSTACVVLLSPSKLYVANVGDSRAVVGLNNKIFHETDPVSSHPINIRAIELTVDQNANDPIERQRILDCGGYVTLPRKGYENEIPARVWSDERCTQIGLGMSRSFGDFALKDVGVIVDPVITEVDLHPKHEFLIVATDGIWEFIDSSEAVVLVHNCFERGLGASEACEELMNCAKDRWKTHEGQYRDDITAIILRLNNLWTEEGQINCRD